LAGSDNNKKHMSSGRKREEGATSEFLYDSVVKYTAHSCRGSSMRQHATIKVEISEDKTRLKNKVPL